MRTTCGTHLHLDVGVGSYRPRYTEPYLYRTILRLDEVQTADNIMYDTPIIHIPVWLHQPWIRTESDIHRICQVRRHTISNTPSCRLISMLATLIRRLGYLRSVEISLWQIDKVDLGQTRYVARSRWKVIG
jgi:hypothetical protein